MNEISIYWRFLLKKNFFFSQSACLHLQQGLRAMFIPDLHEPTMKAFSRPRVIPHKG